MCILQLVFVGCYIVSNGFEYCYRLCTQKKFRIIEGGKLWDTLPLKMEECAICFEEMNTNDMLIHVNQCRHVFHMNCMKEWNNNYNQSCPTCRGTVGMIL